MTCITDEASDTETREREQLLADRRALADRQAAQAAARIATRGPDAPCVDCEDPIPAARQEAVPGCLRCAMCQRRHTQRNRAQR